MHFSWTFGWIQNWFYQICSYCEKRECSVLYKVMTWNQEDNLDKGFYINIFLKLYICVIDQTWNKTIKFNQFDLHLYYCVFLPHTLTQLKSRFELWWNFGGQPGAWLVKKNVFMHAITKFHKGPHIEIQHDFQNMFCFYDSLNGFWVKSLYWCSLWWHLPWKKRLQ